MQQAATHAACVVHNVADAYPFTGAQDSSSRAHVPGHRQLLQTFTHPFVTAVWAGKKYWRGSMGYMALSNSMTLRT
jgi:hypothetical protein